MSDAGPVEPAHAAGVEPDMRMLVCRIVIICAVAVTSVSGQERRPRPEDEPILAAVRAFCEADDAGRQLTPEGWQAVASWFVAPGARNVRSAIIVDDVAWSLPNELGEDRAHVEIIYTTVAAIDTATAQVNERGYRAIKVRQAHTLTTADRGATWRFEGPVPLPYISVSAAIRDVTALQAAAADRRVKAHAAQTLRFLARHRHWRTGAPPR